MSVDELSRGGQNPPGMDFALISLSGLAVALSGFALARSFGARSPGTVKSRLDALEASATLWKSTAAELIERSEDVFGRIERKRASAAAAAARAERGAHALESPPEPIPLNRAEARALRRSVRGGGGSPTLPQEYPE